MQPRQERLGIRAAVRVGGSEFAVYAKNYRGGLLLLRRVDNARGNVGTVAAHRLQRHARARRRLSRHFKEAFSLAGTSRHVAVVGIAHHVYGNDIVGVFGVAYKHRKADQLEERVRIRHTDKHPFAVGRLRLSRLHLMERHASRRPFGDDAAHHACDKNQSDSSVQHLIPQ